MLKNYDVVLIDGSSYLFRAYHALPPLINDQGMPTGAIFGVLNMIARLEKQHPAAKIIVVFDPKGGTFRHEMYAGYKADRQKMPDDLAVQIPILHEVIVAKGLPLIIQQGYEADDVIAAIVKMAKTQSVLISTLDKDLAQLVSDRVHIINTMHNKLYDPEGVMNKFGVRPDQVRDYLALVGDRADCVPGVPGVGPKTAAKWLNVYEDLKGVCDNAGAIKGKVGERLRESLLDVALSQQLVTLVDELPLGDSIDEIQGSSPNIETLRSLYKTLGFKRLYAELSTPADIAYSVVRGEMGIKRLEKIVSMGKPVALYHDADRLALTIEGHSFVLDVEDVASVLKQLFDSMRSPLVVIDRKSLTRYTEALGIAAPNQVVDLYLLAHIHDSRQSLNLPALANRYLKEAFADRTGEEDWVARSLVVGQLYKSLKERLSEKDWYLYQEVEYKITTILMEMEKRGVLIDRQRLVNYEKQLAEHIANLEKEAHTIVGESFNLSSPKQLRVVLFETLGLPVIEKTKGGEASTAENTLHALLDKHPLVQVLIQHRSLSKLRSTYCEGLLKQCDAFDVIHGTFNQMVTVTGRLSSTHPNLQNIPIKTEAGRKIRECFIPRPGYTLLSCDYSQIELRIMAHYSKDAGLVNAFQMDQDVHQATAAKVFGVSLSDVSEAQRRQAKAVNFGLIYGMSAFGLAKQLEIDKLEAQQIIDRYFEEYPGVYHYMQTVSASAETEGYVETLLGRKIFVEGVSKRGQEYKAAIRAAINAPMQGSASELIKMAMIKVVEQLGEYDYQMILQVHDELVFEVKLGSEQAFQKQVIEIMENVYALAVPLKVNAAVGKHWGEAH